MLVSGWLVTLHVGWLSPGLGYFGFWAVGRLVVDSYLPYSAVHLRQISEPLALVVDVGDQCESQRSSLET